MSPTIDLQAQAPRASPTIDLQATRASPACSENSINPMGGLGVLTQHDMDINTDTDFPKNVEFDAKLTSFPVSMGSTSVTSSTHNYRSDASFASSALILADQRHRDRLVEQRCRIEEFEC